MGAYMQEEESICSHCPSLPNLHQESVAVRCPLLGGRSKQGVGLYSWYQINLEGPVNRSETGPCFYIQTTPSRDLCISFALDELHELRSSDPVFHMSRSWETQKFRRKQITLLIFRHLCLVSLHAALRFELSGMLPGSLTARAGTDASLFIRQLLDQYGQLQGRGNCIISVLPCIAGLLR